jgi:hypothetical protein
MVYNLEYKITCFSNTLGAIKVLGAYELFVDLNATKVRSMLQGIFPYNFLRSHRLMSGELVLNEMINFPIN